MNWLNNLSFRLKLTLPIGLLALLATAVAVDVLTEVRAFGREIKALVDVHMPAVNNLLQADRDLYQALVAERSIIFMNAKSPEFASQVKDHAENTQQARERVDKFAAIASESGMLAEADIDAKLKAYDQLRQQWEQLSAKVVQERSSDSREGRSTAIELTLGPAGDLFQQMRTVLDQLSEVVINKAQQTAGATQGNLAKSQIHLGIMLLIELALCGLLVVFLPPLITRPLKRMLAHLRNIADGEGDLTVRLEAAGRDEAGQLAQAFNRFMSKLQELVTQTVASAQQLSVAGERLAVISAASDQAVSEQLTQIEQVAAAMNEMSATVHEVARNAANAADSAHAADAGAHSGARVVADTIGSIRELAGSVQNASGAIRTLESESNKIGTVLEVIKGVAEQTNLLALNAAIEAARAGEMGRGFAVVADEVRSLASRTQQSTREIAAMTESLRSSAEHTVAVMESSQSLADASVQKADQAGKSLETITKAVATINDLNTQIASAAEEQSSVSEDINGNTAKIHDLAEKAAEGSRQTAAAADELARLATELRQRLARFKV